MDWTTYGGWFDAGSWTLRMAPGTEEIMAEHLAHLVGGPDAYREFAQEQYELEIPAVFVTSVFAGSPLDPETIAEVFDRDLEDLTDDVEQIGYPS